MAHTVAHARSARPLADCRPAGGANNLGLPAVDPSSGLTPQELLVAVTTELLGESPGVGAELLEGFDDIRRHE